MSPAIHDVVPKIFQYPSACVLTVLWIGIIRPCSLQGWAKSGVSKQSPSSCEQVE